MILPEGEQRLPSCFKKAGNGQQHPPLGFVCKLQIWNPSSSLVGIELCSTVSVYVEVEISTWPRVQIRIPQASQTVALESYPLRFGDIQPSAVFLNIDGMHHPIGNAIESKPEAELNLSRGARKNHQS